VRFGKERFDVDLRRGTLEELDAEPGSVDSAVMLDVLEHLVDPLEALRRLGGVLAPDGLLTLSTVNVSSLHARVRKDRWPWFIRPHLHYFSPETLHAMLEAAGLRVVEWAVVPRSFHVSYVANRLASSHGALGQAAVSLSRIADVRVPVGWLGDVVLVHARPTRDGG
jgi:SAM-dependent methyltransferase